MGDLSTWAPSDDQPPTRIQRDISRLNVLYDHLVFTEQLLFSTLEVFEKVMNGDDEKGNGDVLMDPSEAEDSAEAVMLESMIYACIDSSRDMREGLNAHFSDDGFLTWLKARSG